MNPFGKNPGQAPTETQPRSWKKNVPGRVVPLIFVSPVQVITMKTPPPFGVPVIIHWSPMTCTDTELTLIACICRKRRSDLMIAVHDPIGYINWNVRDHTGSVQWNFYSWELLQQKNLPLLVSYEYKWPLYEKLLNGTTPFPT
jgi:hypothetical protein